MRITVDMVQANKELTALRKELGLSLRTLMYDQGRLLAQDAVKTVPPGPKGTTAAQKKAGQGAILGDLNKMFFTPDNEAALKSWEDRLDQSAGDIVTVTKRGIRRVQKRKLREASKAEIARLHKKHRDQRTGRVRFSKDASELAEGKYIVDRASLLSYYKDQIKKVGQLKAGFVPAADHFAGLVGTTAKAIPVWVRKQQKRMGSQTNGINSQTGEGFVEIINTTPYAGPPAIPKSMEMFLESKRQTDINKQAVKRLRRVAKEHNDRYARAA